MLGEAIAVGRGMPGLRVMTVRRGACSYPASGGGLEALRAAGGKRSELG
jgi:hypothetical protein